MGVIDDTGTNSSGNEMENIDADELDYKPIKL